MEQGSEATGLVDAVIVDHLLQLGIDDPLAMSYEERLAAIRGAVADGRIAGDQAARLRELGLLQDPTDSGLRERWTSWAQQTLGGSQVQVEAAAAAIMQAIQAGGSQDMVVEQARAAWTAAGASPAAEVAAANTAPTFTAPPAERPPSPVAAPSSGESGIRGRVAGFQQRNEQSGRRYASVWSFRVERSDRPPVAVEMRGYSFAGSIANGDEVRIGAAPRRGDIVRANSLENLTSNSTVRVTSRPHPVARGFGTALTSVLKLVVLLAVAAVVAVAAVLILNHGSF